MFTKFTDAKGLRQAATTLCPAKAVFIFGSNEQGFHGAGSAGFAFRGDSANTWRQDKFFLNAIAESRQGKHTVGKRAIFGIARGFMHGIEGDSYAICTVSRPGQKRSRSRKEIARQLRELWHYAKNHPELTFWFTPVGCGYTGYTAAEMQEVLDWLAATIRHPSNILNLDCYQSSIDKSNT